MDRLRLVRLRLGRVVDRQLRRRVVACPAEVPMIMRLICWLNGGHDYTTIAWRGKVWSQKVCLVCDKRMKNPNLPPPKRTTTPEEMFR